MEQSKKLTGNPEETGVLLTLAKNQEVIMANQDKFGGELRHLRDVVIGNGDSSSMLNQIKQLEFGQAIAKSDRERMEKQMGNLGECVTRMERDEIENRAERRAADKDRKEVLDRLDDIEVTQEEHGTLIAAFRNRVIGIVAVLSLLTGAGAGFVVAARLLSAAVP